MPWFFVSVDAVPLGAELNGQPEPGLLTLSRVLARSLPPQRLFAPCEYALYWRRRKKPLERQLPSPSSRDSVRGPCYGQTGRQDAGLLAAGSGNTRAKWRDLVGRDG